MLVAYWTSKRRLVNATLKSSIRGLPACIHCKCCLKQLSDIQCLVGCNLKRPGAGSKINDRLTLWKYQLELLDIAAATRIPEPKPRCDAMQVPLHPGPSQMLRVRSLRRIATGYSGPLPAVESLPIAQSQSSKPRIPLLPFALLFLCGLVAARVFPDSNLISGEAGLGPGIVLPQLQQPEMSLPGSVVSPSSANWTGLGLRCQTWCLTRDIYVTRDEVAHCQRQCTAHPEVMDWIPALKASAAAPAGINGRKLIFAAWYAEGERGSEVCLSSFCLALPCRRQTLSIHAHALHFSALKLKAGLPIYSVLNAHALLHA